MRVLAMVYEPDGGPGVFADPILAGGHRLDEWMVPDDAEPPADPLGYDAVITLGGSMQVDQRESHPWLAAVDGLLAEMIDRGTPLIGLCLGGQQIAAAAGGAVRAAPLPEIGWKRVELSEEGRRDPLLGPLAPSFEAFEWHSYEFPLPPGAVALARSEISLQGARVGERAWALQFHPEVSAANAASWIRDYGKDESARRVDLDQAAFAAETEEKIGAFNQLGRELCERWLATAS